MHHYPHHIGDYRAHTAHLTMTEDGCYRRLLDLSYMTEKPLPCDVAAVQRLAGARDKTERAAVETVLREFFTLQEDGWHQSRVDHEVAGYQARADQARKNGKGGGRPKTKTKPTYNQPGFSSDTGTEPNEKLTVNREPLTDNQSERENALTRAAVAKGFEIFNEVASRVGWPQVQRMDDKRRKAMAHRLRECGGIDGFSMALAKCEGSDFLTGKSGKWTGFSIDWLLKPANFTKVMEGNYDRSVDGSRANGSSTTADFAAAADLLRDRVYSGV